MQTRMDAQVVGVEAVSEKREASPRRRWGRLARLIKDAMFFVYLYCGFVQVRDLVLSFLGRSRAVVVYYHRVGGCDVLSRPVKAFEQDLAYFKRHYECISLAELCRRLRDGRPIRRRTLVVTFDDGYRDNFTRAMPLLAAAGVPATFFVSTGFVGTDRVFEHDARRDSSVRHANLSWDELRAMEAAGFEVGSHTVHHVNLGRADAQTVRREIRESLAQLNQHLGARPRAFSFPWGKPGDLSEGAIGEVQGAGCYAVASAYGGCNRRGGDCFRILRMDVGNGNLSRLAVRARVAGLVPFPVRQFRVGVRKLSF